MDTWESGLIQLPAKEPTEQSVRWFKSNRVRQKRNIIQKKKEVYPRQNGRSTFACYHYTI